MSMTPFERRSVWLTTAGTLITGVVYWWMKDMMTPPEPWSAVNHPLQPWVLKAHILIAPFQVFSVGLITSRHIWKHLKQGVKKGRRTGVAAAGTFVALVLTGYALQVVTAELLIRTLALSHLVLGVVYSVGVAAHWPATRNGNGNGRTKQRFSKPGTRQPASGLGSTRVPEHDRRRRNGRRTRQGAEQPADRKRPAGVD